jgi:hypothetical protein
VHELEEHWPKHWQEVAMHKDKVPLDPNFAEYERLHETGQLHVTVGRVEERLHWLLDGDCQAALCITHIR